MHTISRDCYTLRFNSDLSGGAELVEDSPEKPGVKSIRFPAEMLRDLYAKVTAASEPFRDDHEVTTLSVPTGWKRRDVREAIQLLENIDQNLADVIKMLKDAKP